MGAEFMFEKLSDNLNLLMNETQLSADELGRRTGLPASTIKKIRNRYSPNPTLTTLLPLAKFFSVTLGQLVGDEPLTRESSSISPVYTTPSISWLETLSWPKNQSYMLTVEENDWEDLSRGTLLLIDPALNPEHRDLVVVHKTGQPTPGLKQILFDEEQAYLKPLIKGYSISPLTGEHTILGVLVEHKKILRQPID